MRKVLLIGNSAYSLLHYREKLIRSLLNDEKYHVSLVIPSFEYPIDKNISDKISIYRYFIRPHSKAFYNEIFCIFSLGILIWKTRPDFILTFTIKPNLYVSIINRLLKFSHIINVTGLGYFKHRLKFIKSVRLIYFYVIKNAQTIFLQNQADLEFFEKYAGHTRLRRLKGSGVDLSKFAESGVPSSSNLSVWFAGRLLIEKGIFELVDAIKILRTRGVDVQLHVFGNLPNTIGPSDKKKYSTLLNDFSEIDAITYHGHVDDIASCVSEFDVCCLPSNYAEGIPRSLIEALALGKIIVTTNTDGCRETCNGNNGYFIKNVCAEVIADVLQEIALLPQNEKKKLGVSSRRLAEQEFSEDLIVSKYFEEFMHNSKTRVE